MAPFTRLALAQGLVAWTPSRQQRFCHRCRQPLWRHCDHGPALGPAQPARCLLIPRRRTRRLSCRLRQLWHPCCPPCRHLAACCSLQPPRWCTAATSRSCTSPRGRTLPRQSSARRQHLGHGHLPAAARFRHHVGGGRVPRPALPRHRLRSARGGHHALVCDADRWRDCASLGAGKGS